MWDAFVNILKLFVVISCPGSMLHNINNRDSFYLNSLILRDTFRKRTRANTWPRWISLLTWGQDAIMRRRTADATIWKLTIGILRYYWTSMYSYNGIELQTYRFPETIVDFRTFPLFFFLFVFALCTEWNRK